MRDQQKICREEWFKDHKAGLHTDLPDIKIINWQKPTSWNYGCRFIIHSQWLTVVGDLGEAVYQWGQNLDLKFLGQINFDYFMGKCRASEVGTKFRMAGSIQHVRCVGHFVGLQMAIKQLTTEHLPDRGIAQSSNHEQLTP